MIYRMMMKFTINQLFNLKNHFQIQWGAVKVEEKDSIKTTKLKVLHLLMLIKLMLIED